MDDADAGGTLWDHALAWAGELAARSYAYPSGQDEWDLRGAAGTIAITAFALALRHQVQDVREVGLDRLYCPLLGHERVERLAHAELPAAGHDLEQEDTSDPVSTLWAWLSSPWPADKTGQPIHPWSIGGRCAPNPPLQSYLLRACVGVDAALTADRGGLPSRTRVRIIGGNYVGQHGFVEHPAWRLNDSRDQVVPGPPGGYMVNLAGQADPRIERVLAAHLTPDQ